jgi:hypothetical protein
MVKIDKLRQKISPPGGRGGINEGRSKYANPR